MNLQPHIEAWLMRAQAAVDGRFPLDPATEVAAAKQALGDLIPTMPEPRCEACEDD